MPLRLVRRPKSPYWVIRGTIRRIRVEESTGTDDKKIADEIRAKREAELLREFIYGRRATATFAQAALSYLEQGGSTRYLNKIIAYFGTTALARMIRMQSTVEHEACTRTCQTRPVSGSSTGRCQQSSGTPRDVAGRLRPS